MHVDPELSAGKAALVGAPLAPVDGLHPEVEFHGPAPVGRLDGHDAVMAGWIAPVAAALPDARWVPDLFLGGLWHHEGTTERWVATHGHLEGPMANSLFGVPRVREGEAQLRLGVFQRVESSPDGPIVVEVRLLTDLVALAAQAGVELLPPFSARAGRPPGPALANGVVTEAADPAESADTLQLVEDMLGGCNRLVDGELKSMGMDAYWHEDMRWYGPHGVGSTHGFDEFQVDAQGPSVASFPNRRGGHHRARFADGVTAAFTGWPSLRGTFDGVPFRGIEPTGGPIGQNIMDFYVRRGPNLHENWVLIDLIDFAAQCGVDLLEELDS